MSQTIAQPTNESKMYYCTPDSNDNTDALAIRTNLKRINTNDAYKQYSNDDCNLGTRVSNMVKILSEGGLNTNRDAKIKRKEKDLVIKVRKQNEITSNGNEKNETEIIEVSNDYLENEDFGPLI